MRIGALSFDPVMPPAGGRVIGVFRHAIAWLDRLEELHSLTIAGAGNAGATTLVDAEDDFSFHDTGIVPGDEVVRLPAAIGFGTDRLIVGMGDAEEWRSPEPGTLDLNAVRTNGPPPPTPGGLGRAAEAMAHALRAHDDASTFEAGKHFVGRGVGLTPSGDDFLGGILATGVMAEGVDSWIGETARRLGTYAEGRTTIYSVGMLRHIARGRPFALLSGFLFALAAGDEGKVNLAAARLAGRGATSGREAAQGVLFAVLSLSGEVHETSPSGHPTVADETCGSTVLNVLTTDRHHLTKGTGL